MAGATTHDRMLGTQVGVPEGSEVMVLGRNPATVNSVPSASFFGPNTTQAARGDHTHTLATTVTPGLMASGDKAKLDALNVTAMLPVGGSAGQALIKTGPANYAVAWGNVSGTGGGAGWAQYDTAANLAQVNPVLAVGTSGYETDTKRWKLGDGSTAWNSLPYQDQPRTPGTITNPGTTVAFGLRPGATQAIIYSSHPGGTVTVAVPTGAPPSTHEAGMFFRITNNTASTITITAPGYNVIGDYLTTTIPAGAALEWPVWVQGGVWYIGGEFNLGAGSVTNAVLATMASGTIKARVSAGTGAPEDATAAQVRALIDAAQPSIVTASGAVTLTRAAHQGKTIVCSTALNVTVNTSTDFDQQAECRISAEGGSVTVVASTTVNGPTLSIAQYKVGILRRMTTADTYSLQVI